MKTLGSVLAVLGRFIGVPTIQGYQASNVMIAADSVILLAIICKLSAR